MNRNFFNTCLSALVFALVIGFSESQAGLCACLPRRHLCCQLERSLRWRDIRAESGLGVQVGFMKDTVDAGTVPVYQSTAQPPSTEPVLFFRPAPVIVTISHPVTFTLTSLNPISLIELDGNSDGIIDFVGSNLTNQAVSFTTFRAFITQPCE